MAGIIIVIGSLIVLTGCIGFVRFGDFHSRIQVIVKSVPFGISVILFGVFWHFGFSGMGIRALIAVGILWFLVPMIGYAVSSSVKNAEIDTK